MNLKRRLHRALAIKAKEFNHALGQGFEPTTGNYPERMVSYYYIQAIAMALPRANVFLEVPVTGKRGRKQDNHIDALVFNDREIVIAEFKVGWAQSHWDALARDLARLQGPVAQEIRGKFKKAGRHPWIFLGADCWRQKVADVWKSGNTVGRRTVPPTLGKAHRDYVRVWEGTEKSCDGYYLTWALLPFDEMAA